MQYANNKNVIKYKAQQHRYWSILNKSQYFSKFDENTGMTRGCTEVVCPDHDRSLLIGPKHDAHLNLNTQSATTAACISSSRALSNTYTLAHYSCMTLMWQREVSSHALVARILCINKLNASIDSMKLQHRRCIRSIRIINNVCVRAWRHASRDCHSPARAALLSPGDADAEPRGDARFKSPDARNLRPLLCSPHRVQYARLSAHASRARCLCVRAHWPIRAPSARYCMNINQVVLTLRREFPWASRNSFNIHEARRMIGASTKDI